MLHLKTLFQKKKPLAAELPEEEFETAPQPNPEEIETLIRQREQEERVAYQKTLTAFLNDTPKGK